MMFSQFCDIYSAGVSWAQFISIKFLLVILSANSTSSLQFTWHTRARDKQTIHRNHSPGAICITRCWKTNFAIPNVTSGMGTERWNGTLLRSQTIEATDCVGGWHYTAELRTEKNRFCTYSFTNTYVEVVQQKGTQTTRRTIYGRRRRSDAGTANT